MQFLIAKHFCDLDKYQQDQVKEPRDDGVMSAAHRRMLVEDADFPVHDLVSLPRDVADSQRH